VYDIDEALKNPLVERNIFRTLPADDRPLPIFEAARERLPEPYWEGRQSVVDCYWYTWQTAFANLHRPVPGSGFVSAFLNPGENDSLFMWDAAFSTMFGRYGRRAFNFQRTLDNLYAKQRPDGFICREIEVATGNDRFDRFNPASTGPNILAWAEWEWYLHTLDLGRVALVFPVLLAYHRWLRGNRTWRDGSYWSSGLGSGMPNQPRVDPARYALELSHGHNVWVDACMQQLLSCRLLLRMGQVVGYAGDLDDLQEEQDLLLAYGSQKLWNEETRFYHDLDRKERPTGLKSIGAYWALLAGAVLQEKVQSFADHLRDPGSFNRPHRVPSLPADHPAYRPDGESWLGGVWPHLNYMLLRGLTLVGEEGLALEIAGDHLERVVEVFEKTGTLWENYAPEGAAPGNPARPNFVGWAGLTPVAVLLEFVFGLRPDPLNERLVWHVRQTAAHGVKRYPFGPSNWLDLACIARKDPEERPNVTITAVEPVTVEVIWPGGMDIYEFP
jgi:hypothetical protein